jgi:hypothetical protein
MRRAKLDNQERRSPAHWARHIHRRVANSILRAREWITRSPSRSIHPRGLRCSSVTYRRVCSLVAPRPRGGSTAIIDRFIHSRALRVVVVRLRSADDVVKLVVLEYSERLGVQAQPFGLAVLHGFRFLQRICRARAHVPSEVTGRLRSRNEVPGRRSRPLWMTHSMPMTLDAGMGQVSDRSRCSIVTCNCRSARGR